MTRWRGSAGRIPLIKSSDAPAVQLVRERTSRRMDRWSGKVALVTGASSGIGAALCKSLVGHGVKVVGAARRIGKLQELAAQLGKGKFYPIECDVMKEEQIIKTFQWIEKELGGVDIMVNNAGVATFSNIIDTKTEEYRRVIDTNLIAPAICAREAIQSMRKRQTPGHLVNINSIAGQYAESLHIPIGMYAPSKYGLRALGTELRHEIIAGKLPIKITNISPGAVLTEIITGVINVAETPDLKILKDKDVADAVIYALGTPPNVEIPEVTIIPHAEVIGTPSGFLNRDK